MRGGLIAIGVAVCSVVLVGCSGARPVAVTSARLPARTPELESWEVAGRAYNAGNYSEAITGYRAFLSQYPHSPHNQLAHYFIAESLNRLGKTSEAMAAYQEVVQRNPETIWAQLARDKQRELQP